MIHIGYDSINNGGLFAVRGIGVNAIRFPHRDCLGITKRDIVGKERRGVEDKGGIAWDALDADRSVDVKIESSGT